MIVEDDPYGALRFRGSPVPPVRTFTDLAVTLGTVSKLLAPGLRVGWLAAPEWLHGPLVRLKQAADLHTSTLCQRIAVDVLSDEPFMAAHLAGLGPFYGARCDALVAALQAHLGDRVSFDLPDGGMFLWLRLEGSAPTARDLLVRAVEAGRGVRARRRLPRRRHGDPTGSACPSPRCLLRSWGKPPSASLALG